MNDGEECWSFESATVISLKEMKDRIDALETDLRECKREWESCCERDSYSQERIKELEAELLAYKGSLADARDDSDRYRDALENIAGVALAFKGLRDFELRAIAAQALAGEPETEGK